MSFSQDDQQKYKALYLQTAREYVKALKDNLAQLSSGNATEDVISTLHRSAHSLRGQSEMMGYHSVGAVTSVMENIFLAKKENKLVLSDEVVKKLTEAVNRIDACVEEIDKNNKESDTSEITKSLQSLVTIPS